MKAILRDYQALFIHFTKCAADNSRNSKERSKYQGLVNKMQSWFFVAETTLLKDALRLMKDLSLFFQSDSASVIDAMAHISVTQEKIIALKNGNGKSLQRFLSAYDSSQMFHGVPLIKCNSDAVKFLQLKLQFHQALADNMQQRFPSTEFLKAAQVLNKSSWPTNAVELALYGDNDIASLSKKLGFSSNDIAEVVFEFAMFKKKSSPGLKLTKVMELLAVYPISSAACERGFSQMNLQQTSLRSSLHVCTVSSLLMISINGPPLEYWNPRRYVLSWLKSGHRSALDKITGVAAKPQELNQSWKLFTSLTEAEEQTK